ncbi:MAG: LacI family DNA-binding transcriptional regulator [Phycisphaeraceae bacterium JB051]
MKDVAQQAGCSPGVVSAVLNKSKGNIGVAQATRERVLEVAKVLKYRPNHAARALARRRTMTLGLAFAPGITVKAGALFQMRMIQGIESVCHAHGYDILLVQGSESDSVESALLRLAPDRVDGLILILRNQLNEHYMDIVEDLKHVVSIGHAIDGDRYPAVLYDNDGAMALAIDHLIAQQATRIGFLGECRSQPHEDNLARRNAFRQILADRQMMVNEQWIHCRDFRADASSQPWAGDSFREGYFGARYIFEHADTKPDALVGYNDMAIAGALRYLTESGLKCPEDCKLIGVDDSEFCTTCTPTLSTISQPLEAMGKEAATMLLQMVEQDAQNIEASPVTTQVLNPKLIARESTGVAMVL